jgi:mono/diheme cytochrome c family protein
MVKRMLIAVVALAISAGLAQAQTIKKEPITPTLANDPKLMFDTYCAVCHAKDGTGTGPAAKALTKTPADLTKISARNGGVFPEAKVTRFIEGDGEVVAHGTRDMPIWGDLFHMLDNDKGVARLRVAALVNYLKAMQKK